MKKCDNCGTPESDQTLVTHTDELWCLDCMRRTGYCILCDAYIPNLVEDYFEYNDDECPKCAKMNN